jgi:hypothetical protein
LEDDVVEEMAARRKSKAKQSSMAKAPSYINNINVQRYFGI